MTDKGRSCETCFWSDGQEDIDGDTWCEEHEMYVPREHMCSRRRAREDQDE